MTRFFHPLLTLAAVAAVFAAGSAAHAGKGFSIGGGGVSIQSRGSNFARQSFPQQGNFQRQFHAQAMNGPGPKSQPNMLQGNVRNPLLGNGTGANPGVAPQGIAAQPGARGIGPAVGGQIQSRGVQHVAANVGGHGGGKFVSNQVKGKADCRRVIDMLVRHCIANRTVEPCVKQFCPDPALFHGGWMPGPMHAAPVIMGDFVPGDMELIEVSMVSDATPEQGPLYQVTLKNNSRIAAEHFRVSIVAVLGEIAVDSPSVTVNVDGIGAGETATLQIQMPVTVMQLGPQGAEVAAFDTMVVAIDSFDELMESNEVNNVATLKRGEVKLIEVTTVTQEAPAAIEQAPAGEAPAAQAPVEGAPAAPATPEAEDGENIDIDNLELENADADEAKELFTR